MLPIQTLHRHSDSVNTLVINRDLLLSGSDDTEIKVSLSPLLHLFCCIYTDCTILSTISPSGVLLDSLLHLPKKIILSSVCLLVS